MVLRNTALDFMMNAADRDLNFTDIKMNFVVVKIFSFSFRENVLFSSKEAFVNHQVTNVALLRSGSRHCQAVVASQKPTS